MAMVYCRGCGQQIHEMAPACPGCGASQVATATRKGGAATAKPETLETVSEGWRKKFALMEKAGGSETPNTEGLSFWQRGSVNYNIGAFLLGPIYYAIKGMWKKAIVLSGITIIATVVLALILEYFKFKAPPGWLLGAVLFGVRANTDYYKKVVQKDNGWW